MHVLPSCFQFLRKTLATAFFIVVILVGAPGQARNAQATTLADFVFVIDATGSMAPEIAAVQAGLSSFVSGLGAADVSARFAVVLYGHAPELVQDFTSDLTTTLNTFSQISVAGAVAGFQNNHNINPEAALEAIRIVLNEGVNNTLIRTHVGGAGPLAFLSDARKNIILVTDEDSDRPFYSENRFTGQTTGEPPASIAGTGWQDEVDAIADALIEHDAFINMLINRSDAPSIQQFGDYLLDVADANLLNYDEAATLLALQGAGLGNSLQAQILAAGLIARTFDINAINTENFINNFFAAKIEETVNNPVPTNPEVPEPATLFMVSTGILGFFMRRRAA